MQQWLPLYRELVRTPSVFGQEHDVVNLVERILRDMGVAITAVPFDPGRIAAMPGAQPPFCDVPGRRNLVARVPGSGGGRSIIVHCHLDTVEEGDANEWRHTPYSGEIDNGRIYGRGAFDDKAGAIICLALLQRFARQPLRGDIIAQFVLEDETTGNGSLLCLEDGHRADAAILVDGTRADRGINAHAGNVRFGVRVFGKPASVSVSHVGVNAAELLGRLLQEIRTAVLAWNETSHAPWTRFPSPNQCSVVALACRETALTIPAFASAVCYATFTPPHTLGAFRTLVQQTVAAFAERERLEREPAVDWNGFATEPVRSDAMELEEVIRRAARADIAFGPSTGTSDMRHFVERGIPCLLFGPGRGGNPHRADEWFEIDSLQETTDILARAVEAWCEPRVKGQT